MSTVQGANLDGMFYSLWVEHDPVDLECDDDGMTRQEFRDECDINVLMAQYERTGVVSHVNPRQPMFFDVDEVPDLAGAIALVDAARASFMTLPASVRREFDNDPVRFVEFAQDPANLPKLREWGLAAPAAAAQTPEASSGSSGAPAAGTSPAGS